MRRLHRNILFALVILTFVIGAPLVILYARGIYIDPGAQEVVKTGIILIDTNLPRVTFQLDEEEPQIESDPIAIKNVLPGRHHVAIWRDGYKTWQAHLDVQEEKVTRVEGVTMFLEEPLEEIPIKGPVGVITASPNAEHWLYTITDGDNEGLWLHTSDQENNRQLFDTRAIVATEISSIRWSEDSSTAIIESNTSYELLEPHRAEPTLRKIISKENIQSPADVVSDQSNPAVVYYLTADNELYVLDVANQDPTPQLLAKNIVQMDVGHPKIFALQQKPTGHQLISIDVRSLDDEPIEIAQAPEGIRLELFVSEAADIAVNADGLLYLLEREKDSYVFSLIADSVSNAAWSNNARFLMYQRSGEIWAHDEDPTGDDEPEVLLTRLSMPIAQLQWRDDNAHLMYVTGDQGTGLQVETLLVSRNAPITQNVYQLPSSLENISELQFINRDKDILFTGDTQVYLVTVESEPDFSFPDLLP